MRKSEYFFLVLGVATAVLVGVINWNLPFWMGAGISDRRWYLVPWVIWPIPAVSYVLGVFLVYPEAFRAHVQATPRIVFLGILLSTGILTSPDSFAKRRLFLDGVERRVSVSTRNQLRELLKTIAVGSQYKNITQTEFIQPYPTLESLLNTLYPGVGKVITVQPAVDGINPVKVSWGGHDLMWGVIYGPTVTSRADDIRDLSGNLSIFAAY